MVKIGRSKKRKLSKKRTFCGNSGEMYKFGANTGIYKFGGNEGEIRIIGLGDGCPWHTPVSVDGIWSYA